MLAFVLIVPAARRACQTIAECNAACLRPGLAPARGGTMIDESTSVVDDDLTDFGAEHFSSRPLRSLNVRMRRSFGAPCDWRCQLSIGIIADSFDTHRA